MFTRINIYDLYARPHLMYLSPGTLPNNMVDLSTKSFELKPCVCGYHHYKKNLSACLIYTP